MNRLSRHQFCPVGGGTVEDRLPQHLEGAGVGILCGVLPELLIRIDELQGVARDEVEFVPQLVEPSRLALGEHEAFEVVVLAVVERERHHLVNRHNA